MGIQERAVRGLWGPAELLPVLPGSSFSSRSRTIEVLELNSALCLKKYRGSDFKRLL